MAYETFGDQRTVPTHDRMTTLQTVGMLFGVAFLLVGIAGFIPGITTNVDEMEFAGHESASELLGVFQVSILHNAVHLLFGVLGIIASRHWSRSRAFLLGGGAVYLVLVVYGIAVDQEHDANFVPVNEADDWLHAGLGIAMVALGALLPRPRRTARVSAGESAYERH
jgi:glucose uptake protein GlcU